MPIDNSIAKCVHGSHAECELCGEVRQPEDDDTFVDRVAEMVEEMKKENDD